MTTSPSGAIGLAPGRTANTGAQLLATVTAGGAWLATTAATAARVAERTASGRDAQAFWIVPKVSFAPWDEPDAG